MTYTSFIAVPTDYNKNIRKRRHYRRSLSELLKILLIIIKEVVITVMCTINVVIQIGCVAQWLRRQTHKQ